MDGGFVVGGGCDLEHQRETVHRHRRKGQSTEDGDGTEDRTLHIPGLVLLRSLCTPAQFTEMCSVLLIQRRRAAHLAGGGLTDLQTYRTQRHGDTGHCTVTAEAWSGFATHPHASTLCPASPNDGLCGISGCAAPVSKQV